VSGGYDTDRKLLAESGLCNRGGNSMKFEIEHKGLELSEAARTVDRHSVHFQCQRQARDRPETDQRQARDRPETGQKRARNRPEIGQKQARNRIVSIYATMKL
jgi:hypothetical protein